jgi:uncharacterized membrane protein YkoI
MERRTKIGASIAAGVTAVVAVAAIAVASPETGAQAADSTPNPTTSTAPQDGSGKGMGRPQETPLTGAALEDATAAAKAAVPGGTIIRVETDGDGGATYEAHVRKADGTEVVVKMDKEFKVTGTEAFAGRGGQGGQGGRGGMGGPNETPLTGADADKATAAAKEAVSGGTVLRVETDGDGGAAYEAHVRKADGTEVVVKMDKQFNVTGTEAFAGRGGRGGHDGDGPQGSQDGSGTGSGSSAAPSSTNGA